VPLHPGLSLVHHKHHIRQKKREAEREVLLFEVQMKTMVGFVVELLQLLEQEHLMMMVAPAMVLLLLAQVVQKKLEQRYQDQAGRISVIDLIIQRL